MEHPDKQPIMIIGLSGENITRLMANEPILLDPNNVGLPAPFKIVVMAGRTEDDIRQLLEDKGLFTDKTVHRDERRR